MARRIISKVHWTAVFYKLKQSGITYKVIQGAHCFVISVDMCEVYWMSFPDTLEIQSIKKSSHDYSKT